MIKIELVISENRILYNEILSISAEKKEFSTFFCSSYQEVKDFLNAHRKIDLLIIDLAMDEDLLSSLSRISKKIVNLTDGSFKKPFRLQSLIEILDQSRNSEYIYITLSDSILYDEERSIITSSENEIRLTDKENLLLASLIRHKDNMLTKDEILEKIWGYSSKAETNTIETYISRLRSYLPEGVIVNKNGVVKIMVEKSS